MFETSKDLLYVVLSLSIIWFTVFLCWLLYHAMRAIRNVNNIIENVSHKLELISDAVEFMRHKVETMSGHMGMIGSVVSGLVEKFVIGKIGANLEERSAKKKATKRRSTKKK